MTGRWVGILGLIAILCGAAYLQYLGYFHSSKASLTATAATVVNDVNSTNVSVPPASGNIIPPAEAKLFSKLPPPSCNPGTKPQPIDLICNKNYDYKCQFETPAGKCLTQKELPGGFGMPCSETVSGVSIKGTCACLDVCDIPNPTSKVAGPGAASPGASSAMMPPPSPAAKATFDALSPQSPSPQNPNFGTPAPIPSTPQPASTPQPENAAQSTAALASPSSAGVPASVSPAAQATALASSPSSPFFSSGFGPTSYLSPSAPASQALSQAGYSYNPAQTYAQQTTFVGSSPAPQNPTGGVQLSGGITFPDFTSVVNNFFTSSNPILKYIPFLAPLFPLPSPPSLPTTSVPPPVAVQNHGTTTNSVVGPQTPNQDQTLPSPIPTPLDASTMIQRIANSATNTVQAVSPPQQNTGAGFPASHLNTISTDLGTSYGSSNPQQTGTNSSVQLPAQEFSSATQTAAQYASTHSASSPDWTGVVVDIGVPVDITAPSFESTIANLNGGWTHIRSSLQSKLALAQAQSNYDATAARIGALLDAQTAGICDEKCTSLLASLQAQLPRQRANISALESTVQRDDAAAAFPLPAPIAQMTRIVENVLQTQNASQSPIVQYPNYDNVLYPNTQNGGIHGSVQGTPVANSQNPSLPPASDTLGVQVNTSPSETSGTTSDENPILHIIHEVWNFLTRLFASHS